MFYFILYLVFRGHLVFLKLFSCLFLWIWSQDKQIYFKLHVLVFCMCFLSSSSGTTQLLFLQTSLQKAGAGVESGIRRAPVAQSELLLAIYIPMTSTSLS